MLPSAIDAILNHLFPGRRHDTDTVDQVIDNLGRTDDELERRLRALRAQVDVYQRTMRREGSDESVS